jgi:hypothetical protein
MKHKPTPLTELLRAAIINENDKLLATLPDDKTLGKLIQQKYDEINLLTQLKAIVAHRPKTRSSR